VFYRILTEYFFDSLLAMAGHISRPTGGNTVLLFGPQALSFDEDSFHRLRSSVSGTANQHWVLDTTEELPGYWDDLCKELPKLQAVPGAKLLEDLGDWFRTGMMRQQAASHLPNTLLGPLVVIAQLTQYSEYLKLAHSEFGEQHDLYASSRPDTETIGFCTGILSAMAVSCSTNQAQFAEYGAVAVRLAMLIGALVDAQNALDDHGESRSLATVWKSHQSGAEMTRILQRFPEVNSSRPVSAGFT
jgi:hypothetical protein